MLTKAIQISWLLLVWSLRTSHLKEHMLSTGLAKKGRLIKPAPLDSKQPPPVLHLIAALGNHFPPPPCFPLLVGNWVCLLFCLLMALWLIQWWPIKSNLHISQWGRFLFLFRWVKRAPLVSPYPRAHTPTKLLFSFLYYYYYFKKIFKLKHRNAAILFLWSWTVFFATKFSWT